MKKIFIFILIISSFKLFSQQPGNCLNFDGVDDFVVIPDNDAGISNAITIESWVLWNPNNNNSVQFICAKGNEQFEIHTGGGAGANGIRFIPVSGVYIDALNVLPVGVWTHIACVYENNYANVYVNGEPATIIVSGSTSTPLITNSSSFYLGQRGNGTYRFKGSLDEFRIWGRAKSQSEIQNDMRTNINPSLQTNLTTYFNFNTGTANGINTGLTTLSDLKGSFNGTLNNFTLQSDTSNWIASYAMVVPKAENATNVSTTSFTANWSAPLVGNFDNYELYVSTDKNFNNLISGYNPKILANNILSENISGLTEGKKYYYKLKAKNNNFAGQETFSNVIVTNLTGFSFSPETLNFSSVAGQNTFNIYTSNSWTITSNQSWLTTNFASGTGDKQINASVTVNEDVNPRTGLLTVSVPGFPDKTLTVNQQGFTPILELSPSDITLRANGGTFNSFFSITCNTSWTVSSSEPWLTFNMTSGTGNNIVDLSYEINNTQQNRTAIITVTTGVGNVSKTINVTQMSILGLGTEASPYLIYNYEQLKQIGTVSYQYTKVYKLMANINASASRYENTGEGFKPIGVYISEINSNPFRGIFYGNNYMIDSIYINRPDGREIGFFGCTNGAKIYDLTLTNVDIYGYFNVGAMVGVAKGNTYIANCRTTGKVNGSTSQFGGFIGANKNSEIHNCSSSVNLICGNVGGIGGFVGSNDYGTITDCYATGNVISDFGNYAGVGGFSGINYYGTIQRCYSTGNVQGTSYAGGFTGYNVASTIEFCYSTGSVHSSGGLSSSFCGWQYGDGIIRNCYTTSEIKDENEMYPYLGGIAGVNEDNSEISLCYAAGKFRDVISGYGGLIGKNAELCASILPGTVINSYWDIQVTGVDLAGGIEIGTISGNNPLITIQMKKQSNFSNLDFTNIWQIRENQTYPALKNIDNAPFAFIDTISEHKTRIPFSEYLLNNYDYETFQENLYLRVLSTNTGTFDKDSVYLPLTTQFNDTIIVRYRIGEIRTAKNDTLWGNISTAFLVIDNHPPVLSASDELSTFENTPITITSSDLNFTDIDNDAIEQIVLLSGSNYTVSGTTITPANGFTGQLSIPVYVTNQQISNTINLIVNVIPRYLNVSAENLTIEADENSTTNFQISSNTIWNISSNETWLIPDIVFGENDTTITLTAQQNPNTTSRTAVVTITGTDVENKTINVTQDGALPVLTVSVNNVNSGTASGSGTYNYNQSVTVTAIANTGYHFVNWTEDENEVSLNPEYTFNIITHRTLVANFEINTYTISTSVNPANSGTIDGLGTGIVAHGETVSLIALPNTGYTFQNWTENGNILTTNSTYSFTANSNRNLVANFDIIENDFPTAGILTFSTTDLGTQTRTATSNVYDLGEISSTDNLTSLKIEIIDDNINTSNKTVWYNGNIQGQMIFTGSNNLWQFQPTAPFNWAEGINTLTTQFIDLDNNTLDITVNFTLVQKYLVNFSVINGNGTLLATVNDNPITSGSAIEKGGDVVFTATPSANYKVKEWKLNGNIQSETGNILTIENLQENINVTVEFDIIENITLLSNYGITVFPNPTSGELKVKSEELKVINVEIFDITGRLANSKFKIQNNYKNEVSNSEFVIDLSTLNSGIYFLKMETDKGILIEKIMKQ